MIKGFVKLCLFWLVSVISVAAFGEDATGKHLFILSGQSNMHLLDPRISFVPMVEREFGKENVIVIKTSHSGFPIRRWHKDWHDSEGSVISFRGPTNEMLREKYEMLKRLIRQAMAGEELNPWGEFHEEIVERINVEVGEQKLASATFVWMHGERDARESYADVYAESLAGLRTQLQQDLEMNVNYVIGRISDWDLKSEKYPEWGKIRDVQVQFAESESGVVWIDTDDLNSGLASNGKIYDNNLHYSVEGYRLLGQRFAEAAILLIREENSQTAGIASP